MREHWIQLRGGWERHDPSARPGRVQRVSLPIEWPPGPPGRVRLIRRFGCPPIDPARESLVLRLENVPGLVAVRFNDRPVEPPAEAGATLCLDPVLSRNELVLEVDPDLAARGGGTAGAWGRVALVVRPSSMP